MKVYHWNNDCGILVDYVNGTFSIEHHNEHPVWSDICVELHDLDTLKEQLLKSGFVQKQK